MASRNLITIGLLVLVCLHLGSAADYCQVLTESENIFLTDKENRTLSLSKYIKGYNLDFAINDTDAASLKQTFAKEDSIDLKFEEGTI